MHEGKDLYPSHPLTSGDREAVHREGYSAKNRTRTEEGVDDEDAFDYVMDWFHAPPQPKRRHRLKVGRK